MPSGVRYGKLYVAVIPSRDDNPRLEGEEMTGRSDAQRRERLIRENNIPETQYGRWEPYITMVDSKPSRRNNLQLAVGSTKGA